MCRISLLINQVNFLFSNSLNLFFLASPYLWLMAGLSLNDGQEHSPVILEGVHGASVPHTPSDLKHWLRRSPSQCEEYYQGNNHHCS
jgi:hypothetical protein